MSRRAVRLSMAQITRAAKAIGDAGLKVQRIELVGPIDKVVFTLSEGLDEPGSFAPFDQWKAKHARAAEGH